MSRLKLRLGQFAVLVGAGSLGVLALVFDGVVDPSQYEAVAAEAGLSVETVLLASALQVLVLLAAAVAAGLYAAPRVGFDSHLANRVADGTPVASGIPPELRPSLGAGAAVGAMLLAIELVAPEIPNGEAWEMTVPALLQSLPLRLLYGGITEELLLRLGVMAVLALVLWTVTGRRGAEPSAGIAWAAIAIAAVLHLPMAATIYGALSPAVVAFIVGANAVGGVAFGWLFWRYSLEVAMVAHAFAHVVAVAGWLVALLV
ncbi:CPBP family glutamic-type intramembrane protease [Natronococcus sp. A-GB1]|uniref:CPBP family glutamic-type intramembrane protease n=1 Tax=Natronococcus sp. A-GB1 TaxID=3037648 RepID=UPI00241BE68A|nr:CPBP family glutamic-type intramembrane protease [Natronococcus sp. A-GB1]MDG5759025.1 CPBP family glutamic-type intramembrane protease [Natronococcus sp. A-GB1]